MTHFWELLREVPGVSRLLFPRHVAAFDAEQALSLHGLQRVLLPGLLGEISVLDLAGCRLPPDAAESIANSLPALPLLQRLALGGNELYKAEDPAGLEPLLRAVALHGSLCSFSLAANRLDACALPMLAILKSSSSLRYLDLSFNPLVAAEDTKAVAQQLGELAQLPALAALNLLQTGSEALPGVPFLPPDITEVHYQGRGLTAQALLVLAEELRDRVGLVSVDLSNNDLKSALMQCPQALAGLLQALHTCPCLASCVCI